MLKPCGSLELGRRLTLLLGLRQKTISECTFRVRSRSSTLSFIALNAAARICTFDTIYRSQSASLHRTHHNHVMHIYLDRSYGREEEGGTHDASIDKGIFEVGVAGEQLGVQEGGVGDGVEEGDVDGVAGGEVVDGDGGERHWGR